MTIHPLTGSIFVDACKLLIVFITTVVLFSIYPSATAQAATTYSVTLSSFSNENWLNGIYRTRAGFNIPLNSTSHAAFSVGRFVQFSDKQVRKITMVQAVGNTLSVFVEGDLLDGNTVGYPKPVAVVTDTTNGSNDTSGSTSTTVTSTVIYSSPLNNFTNDDWLNGIYKTAAGFNIPANNTSQAAFKVGVAVKLANNQVRKITTVQSVGNTLSIFVTGALLDGYTVGYPKLVSVLGNASDSSMGDASSSSSAAIYTVTPSDFTNENWVKGMYRTAAGFNVPLNTTTQLAMQVGAAVTLADGQVRKINYVQPVGNTYSVFVSGAVIDGNTLGYPKPLVVTTATTATNPSDTTDSSGSTTSDSSTSSGSDLSSASSNNSSGSTDSSSTGSASTEPINLVGVNLSAAGFSGSTVPGVYGTHYIYPDESYFKKYAAMNIRLVRLFFLWERLQPKLNTELNAAELARIIQCLDYAQKYGVKVVLDLHNYYRYYDQQIASEAVPITAFADFWMRLTQKIFNHPAVYAYGLMNEPHDTNGQWPQAALAAAKAIRSMDEDHWVFVAGDRWSSAYHWPAFNEALITDPWMRDLNNKLVFEAHMYLDSDYSGNYSDKSETFAADLGVERVKPFVEWLKTHNLRGYLGEHGIPDWSSSALSAMDNLLSYLQQNCIPMTYWAAGPWWGDYALSLDVTNGASRPQLPILQKYAANTACSNIGPVK